MISRLETRLMQTKRNPSGGTFANWAEYKPAKRLKKLPRSTKVQKSVVQEYGDRLFLTSINMFSWGLKYL